MGERLGLEAVTVQARLFHGLAYLQASHPDLAAPHSAAAWSFWRRVGGEALYGWFAALGHATVLVSAGRLEEAARTFAEGVPFRRGSGDNDYACQVSPTNPACA